RCLDQSARVGLSLHLPARAGGCGSIQGPPPRKVISLALDLLTLSGYGTERGTLRSKDEAGRGPLQVHLHFPPLFSVYCAARGAGAPCELALLSPDQGGSDGELAASPYPSNPLSVRAAVFCSCRPAGLGCGSARLRRLR